MTEGIPGLSGRQIRRDWPLVLLLVLLFGLGFCFYPLLPERVPTHWNVRGEIDGYSGRFFAAFGIPAFSLLLYLGFLILPGLDPKRASYQRFAKAYDVIRWGVLGLMVFVQVLVLLAGMGHTIDVGKAVQPATALLFILMGNQMGRVRHNYFVGIRTPWTLANEEVWRRTHRVAGPIFVGAGLLALLGTWLPAPYNFVILMVAVVGSSIAALAYSYLVYRDISARG